MSLEEETTTSLNTELLEVIVFEELNFFAEEDVAVSSAEEYSADSSSVRGAKVLSARSSPSSEDRRRE
jgi:hypothetical protein